MSTVSITRTYERPVTNRQRLGSVPGDFYEKTGWPKHGLGSIQHSDRVEAGPRDVVRSVPEYNADGSPKLETVTETLTAKTYSPRKRAVTCGALAATAAVLATPTGPVGMALAGLAGAAVGAVLGHKTAENDEVREVWTKPAILHPEMEGHYHVTVPVPQKNDDDEYSIRGYVHHFQPDIEHTQVGSYDRPTLQHKRKIGGALAAAAAAGAGIAIGLVAAALGRD